MDRHKGKFTLSGTSLLILLIFFNHFQLIRSTVTVNSNGGYKFALAFEEGTTEPTDLAQFIESMNSVLQQFSEKMFASTEDTFFIEAVDIFFPSNWDIAAWNAVLSINSIHNADLKVSDVLELPEVKNPNTCGIPGEFMKIPINVFSDETNPLGTSWKVLLTQWARLRWGVWPEHGNPVDSRFPNFFPDHEAEEWKRTSCSNVEVIGTYIEPDGEPCSETYPEVPSYSCQFVPDEVGNEGVISSLMSSRSEWLETLTQFCNIATHDKTSPNQQNLFCNQRSILEVIKATEDARQVTEQVEDAPPIEFNYFKFSSSPLLYILVDNGPRTIIPLDIMDRIRTSLVEFFDATTIEIPTDVIGSLGFFPSGEASSSVDRKVTWQSVVDSVDIFRAAIAEDLTFSETEGVQEFIFAIEEVLEELRNMHHDAGAILLVVKVGRLKYAFADVPYEEEILARVTTNQVKIHAIEFEENKLHPSRHLQNLIQGTNGVHRVATSEADLDEQFQTVFEAVRASTLASNFENDLSKTISQKFLKPGESIQLPIFVNSVADSVDFSVTTSHSVSRIRINNAEITFSTKFEWSENVDMSKRLVHYGRITQHLENDGISNLDFQYEDPNVQDEGYVTVTAKLLNSNNIKIISSLSVKNGQIDMANQSPLVVFAQITENSVPLQGVEKVTAVFDLVLLDETEAKQRWAVDLEDNGLGYPDHTASDGIYSGYFIPDSGEDRQYRVTVEAYHSNPTSSLILEEDIFSEPKLHRSTKSPTVRFSEAIEIEGGVIISNPASFTSVPATIYDFEHWARDDYAVTLFWTSPSVLSTSSEQKVSKYEIRYANTMEMLSEENFSSATLFEMAIIILNPGERQSVDFIGDDTFYYYAIKSYYNDIESKVSNTISVRAVPVEVTTPLPPTPPPIKIYTTGYDIVVGIDESTPPPSNVDEYLDKLWTILDKFSEEMFIRTKSTFYIRKAPIIVPRTWNVASVEMTVNSYHTANLRISSQILNPRAENPNTCGLPGSYIELPLNFFDNSDDIYGTPWKSLLHLWGRYRWGIWEEHGYTYSTRFPYSYKKPTQTVWMPTGCSNSDLIGVYRDSNGAICENDGDFSPNVDCHFVVDEVATDVTSSLMHFHWLIPSVTDFCDDTTHDMEPPSKQNIFCSHQSAWEIIQSSPEFNSGNEDISSRPILPKEILKTSDKPLFYLLLDGGHYTVPNSIITSIKNSLVTFFENDIGDETIGAIGTFFNDDEDRAVLVETVPWSPLALSRQDFIAAINTYQPISKDRQFGTAIESTFKNIASLKHQPGVVICILKTGTTSIFDKIPREEELIANLLEQKIKFYAIEFPNTPFRPSINLQTLTMANELRTLATANDYHLAIRDTSSLGQSGNFMRRIGNSLNSTFWGTFHRHIFNSPISPNMNNTLQVFHPGITTLFFAFTVPNTVDPQTVRISRSWGGSELIVNSRLDWDELTDVTRRAVYYGNFSVEGAVQEFLNLNIAFDCQNPSNPSKCIGYLVVHGELDLNSNEEVDELDVQVTTSAHGNILDLSEEMKSTSPFAIFAKITNAQNHPVRNIEEVKASIHCEDANVFYNVDLLDDGQGVPDTATTDGVYSGQFIPPVDGSCLISVFIQHGIGNSLAASANDNFDTNSQYYSQSKSRNSFSDNFLCETGHCNSVTPNGVYQKVFRFAHQLRISNSALWTGRGEPAQILDLSAWALDAYKVNLSWTLPKIFNQDDGRAELCQLYEARNINDFENGIADLVATLPSIGQPTGTKMEYTFQGEADTVYYFAVISSYQSQESPRSNIVGLKTLQNELVTTPMPSPPTVSTTISSTESTTSDPNGGDPSLPNDPTSSSTPTTTPTDDYEYWYERPEGYITLAVFGASAIFLAIGVGVYVYFRKANTSQPRLRMSF